MKPEHPEVERNFRLDGGYGVNDPVNHPAHYTAHPSGVECITITEHFNFNIGNAIKYLWRAGLKGNAVEDLKKAAWYATREAQRIEAAAHLASQGGERKGDG